MTVTKIKHRGSWYDTSVDMHSDKIEKYTFNVNLAAITTSDWFHNHASVDTSTLPDGVYMVNLSCVFQTSDSGACVDCIEQARSTGFIPGFARCVSLATHYSNNTNTDIFIRHRASANKGNSITLDFYCGSNDTIPAQTQVITFIKVAEVNI